MTKLSKDEFMAKYKEDLRKKKANFMVNDADKHIYENSLKIKNYMRRYSKGGVNCGRC